MGRVVDGQWETQWYEPDEKGRFVRPQTVFRRHVEAGAEAPLPALAGRYHLYVSAACPWAHRTLIVRALAGLEAAISVSVVEPFMGEQGWRFDPDIAGATADAIGGREYLHQVYTSADPRYSGRVTVPVLWDRVEQTIVNNESREIIRMLGRGFSALGRRDLDLAPPELLERVEAAIEAIYEPINNGVYRSGFATSQAAYDEAVDELFAALDHWEGVLGEQRWLAGDRMTEADICLFTTLVRFDLVYHGHFKCNRQRVADYPNLSGLAREIYQLPGVAETTNFGHIAQHYYASHETINPSRIVPVGPKLRFDAPHERAGGMSGLELLQASER